MEKLKPFSFNKNKFACLLSDENIGGISEMFTCTYVLFGHTDTH